MRDVAIVAFAQTDHLRRTDELSEVEMLMPVLHRVLDDTGLKTGELGFVCSGSSDYLAGRAFSFTMALDGVGAYPPVSESHVEMDGAWALYEAWVKIRTGQADTALVYSYGKSSPGSVRDVLTRQLDPYYTAPLWPDSVALAALQAQALIDAGDTDETALAAISVPAPVRFSTMKGCLSFSCSSAASMRVKTSVPPPAVNGQMKVTACCG